MHTGPYRSSVRRPSTRRARSSLKTMITSMADSLERDRAVAHAPRGLNARSSGSRARSCARTPTRCRDRAEPTDGPFVIRRLSALERAAQVARPHGARVSTRRNGVRGAVEAQSGQVPEQEVRLAPRSVSRVDPTEGLATRMRVEPPGDVHVLRHRSSLWNFRATRAQRPDLFSNFTLVRARPAPLRSDRAARRALSVRPDGTSDCSIGRMSTSPPRRNCSTNARPVCGTPRPAIGSSIARDRQPCHHTQNPIWTSRLSMRPDAALSALIPGCASIGSVDVDDLATRLPRMRHAPTDLSPKVSAEIHASRR